MRYLNTHDDFRGSAARREIAISRAHLRHDYNRNIDFTTREEKVERQVRWAEVDGHLYLADEVTLDMHLLALKEMIADRKPRPQIADALYQAAATYVVRPTWNDMRQRCRIIRAIRRVLDNNH